MQTISAAKDYFYDMSRRLDKYRKLPIFQKSEEILELAEVIAETLKEDSKKEHLASEILGNAMIMQVKIAGAEGGGLYSLKMQSAVVIKIAAQDMLNAVIFSAMVNINEEDYVQLMREKVEEFRMEFLNWIRGFDKSYDIPDNWGIRYDSSTPEQEKLEELMFDEDKFWDDFDENNLDDDEDWSDEDEEKDE
ncbi:hypothetical protein [Mucilaginibacter sp. BT774]|uniref:hypothetical protein n=1 Tax=Mucilaginibacter sp. BT774 TaxID=3062276 RepID=UPI00267667B0|nr:hypothetical protein [Mucilaginibacter sp. BT774]MDO3626888.1 hypothetical protein [Mucilaginibacter sp. BT774]